MSTAAGSFSHPRSSSFHSLAVAVIMLILCSGLLLTGIDTRAYAQGPPNNAPEPGHQSKPPLTSKTTNGTYTVQLDWEPGSLGSKNGTTIFTVGFYDKSGAPDGKVVNYDFVVSGYDLSLIDEFDNQTTDRSGVGAPLVVRFENASVIEVTIWVNSQGSTTTETFESATFDIAVTPEFPAAIVALAANMMAVLVIVVIVRQSRSNNKHLI